MGFSKPPNPMSKPHNQQQAQIQSPDAFKSMIGGKDLTVPDQLAPQPPLSPVHNGPVRPIMPNLRRFMLNG